MAKDFRRLVSARSRRMFVTDVRDLVEGQQVQIWSESQQSWEHGEVVQKVNHRSKIMVCKRYGDQLREKWLDAALVAKLVQVFASSSASSARESAWES